MKFKALTASASSVVAKDYRTNAVPDPSPVAFYSVTTANPVLRMTMHLGVSAWTSGTISYRASWTEDGHNYNFQETVGAVGEMDSVIVLVPDISTTVNIQAFGPWVATVRITVFMEKIT